MDRDRSVPKLLRQESVDRPIRQSDRGDSAKGRAALAAFEKKPFGEIEWRKGSMKMKTKAVLAIVALSYAPLGVAGNKAEYPNVKVAEFVIERLVVPLLHATLRTKTEKG